MPQFSSASGIGQLMRISLLYFTSHVRKAGKCCSNTDASHRLTQNPFSYENMMKTAGFVTTKDANVVFLATQVTRTNHLANSNLA